MVLAIGKVAEGMERGAMRAVDASTRGLAVCPVDTDLGDLDVIVGDHPVPGPGSFEAGRLLIDAATAAGPDDLVLVLLSGGASAMAEVPAPGISEQQIVEVTLALL